ncbi:MAG: hypothetical protein ABSD38_37070 [Syntrophorhabdales bacterium]|jgi:hypothetical protein|nr:hypothetical protein [Deltaproteobacteria bacterium]
MGKKNRNKRHSWYHSLINLEWVAFLTRHFVSTMAIYVYMYASGLIAAYLGLTPFHAVHVILISWCFVMLLVVELMRLL